MESNCNHLPVFQTVLGWTGVCEPKETIFKEAGSSLLTLNQVFFFNSIEITGTNLEKKMTQHDCIALPFPQAYLLTLRGTVFAAQQHQNCSSFSCL